MTEVKLADEDCILILETLYYFKEELNTLDLDSARKIINALYKNKNKNFNARLELLFDLIDELIDFKKSDEELSNDDKMTLIYLWRAGLELRSSHLKNSGEWIIEVIKSMKETK